MTPKLALLRKPSVILFPANPGILTPKTPSIFPSVFGFDLLCMPPVNLKMLEFSLSVEIANIRSIGVLAANNRFSCLCAATRENPEKSCTMQLNSTSNLSPRSKSFSIDRVEPLPVTQALKRMGGLESLAKA
jgi:hypothetical protein